jgi:coenzyme PQQ precursor peptide PqqA
MPWTKPDFVEISLCMEVTAYVNTDASVVGGLLPIAGEPATAAGGVPSVAVAAMPPSGSR